MANTAITATPDTITTMSAGIVKRTIVESIRSTAGTTPNSAPDSDIMPMAGEIDHHFSTVDNLPTGQDIRTGAASTVSRPGGFTPASIRAAGVEESSIGAASISPGTLQIGKLDGREPFTVPMQTLAPGMVIGFPSIDAASGSSIMTLRTSEDIVIPPGAIVPGIHAAPITAPGSSGNTARTVQITTEADRKQNVAITLKSVRNSATETGSRLPAIVTTSVRKETGIITTLTARRVMETGHAIE